MYFVVLDKNLDRINWVSRLVTARMITVWLGQYTFGLQWKLRKGTISANDSICKVIYNSWKAGIKSGIAISTQIPWSFGVQGIWFNSSITDILIASSVVKNLR